ncbi:YkgJ family cysteine cluster protein [Alteromonas sp. CYL-A6]|uniref:YkgJ family cysteine cluster protein n=1 Tax=Alteromonas nitratireducens TaxID=3390813 RepID=UPI0034B8D605
MQRLRELSGQVLAMYEEISSTFSHYQASAGLPCTAGCGACCNKPDIEVSPLEMLPLALHLFDQGLAETTLESIEHYHGFACMQYQRHSLDGQKGSCGIYPWRPGVCRMFGVAGYRTKDHIPTLSVCREIKQRLPERYADALIMTTANPPPMMAHYQQKLAQLDFTLGEQRLPINEALKYCLEKILTLAAYAPDIDDNAVA